MSEVETVSFLAAHRFKPGDLVHFHRRFGDRRSALGVYTVVRSLPQGEDGQVQYQVKSEQEPYARIALEHHLFPAQPQTDARVPLQRS
jgi:hypothetical protein